MMVTPNSTNSTPRRSGHGSGSAGGPPLLVPAVIFVALFVASVVGVGIGAGGAHFPSPYDPVAKLSDYLTTHHTALIVSAVLQFASAIPLAIFTAAVVARLHNLGIRAPGATIALVGGVMASAMLMISAGAQWVLGQPGIGQNIGVARAFQDMAFITGGPGHVVPFGLLVAGIAVVAAFTRILPRPLTFVGIGIAAVAELSTLTFTVQGMAILLPIARFTGYAWLLAAAALLPWTRPRSTAAPTDATTTDPTSTRATTGIDLGRQS